MAKVPIDQLRSYAHERRWVNLRLVSSASSTYNRDYHGEDDGGRQVSRMNVFTRGDGQIRHFYATEQSVAGPGRDDRHVDLIWPLWNLLDLTPSGRRRDWRPAYSAKRPVVVSREDSRRSGLNRCNAVAGRAGDGRIRSG